MIRMTIGGWGNTFGCLLSASAQSVVERTHRNVVLSAPFGVGQAAPATFVDKADLLLHGNSLVADTCHSLSSCIVAKYYKFFAFKLIG